MEPLSSGEVQSDQDDQAFEAEPEQDPPHWQTLVSTDVLALLPPHEIKRQEVINGKASHEEIPRRSRFIFRRFEGPSSTDSLPVSSLSDCVTCPALQSCSTRSALTCAR